MELTYLLIGLQFLTLLTLLKLLDKNSTKKVAHQAELELDKVLDGVVDHEVKNHETKIAKVITKLSDQAEKELRESTAELTHAYRLAFDQKLDEAITNWSEQHTQTLNQATEKQLHYLETKSAELIQKIAHQSLKKNLTLKDHDQLVKNSLNDILLTIPSSTTLQS
jgi:flagellar motor protein MotB